MEFIFGVLAKTKMPLNYLSLNCDEQCLFGFSQPVAQNMSIYKNEVVCAAKELKV